MKSGIEELRKGKRLKINRSKIVCIGCVFGESQVKNTNEIRHK